MHAGMAFATALLVALLLAVGGITVHSSLSLVAVCLLLTAAVLLAFAQVLVVVFESAKHACECRRAITRDRQP